VFYGLVAQAGASTNAPAPGVVAAPDSNRGPAPGIPRGLRSHLGSGGRLDGSRADVEPGCRVDVQVIHIGEPGTGAASIRTALQSLAVLKVEPREEGAREREPAVVTLVAKPEADILAVAIPRPKCGSCSGTPGQ
jgi:hypothetical protein